MGSPFEGTADDMWAFLAALRKSRRHDGFLVMKYTLSNARFAVTIDPDNADLKQRLLQIEALQANGRATLPTTIWTSVRTNPFCRGTAIRPSVEI